MTGIVVLVCLVFALRFLGARSAVRRSPARELYDRHLRAGSGG